MVKAGEEGGILDIDIKDYAREIRINFTDYGAGISKDDLSKIFDPFFTTAGGMGGVGLGLNIIYRLVNNSLKGSITCDTKLGKGSIFKIIIPKSNDIKSGEMANINS